MDCISSCLILAVFGALICFLGLNSVAVSRYVSNFFVVVKLGSSRPWLYLAN